MLVPMGCWSCQSYGHLMHYLTCPQWSPSRLHWDTGSRACQDVWDTSLCLWLFFSQVADILYLNAGEAGPESLLGPPFSFTSSLARKDPTKGPPGWRMYSTVDEATGSLLSRSYLPSYFLLPLQTPFFYSLEDGTPWSYSLWTLPPKSIKKLKTYLKWAFLVWFHALLLSRINHSEYGQVLVAYGWWYE